MKSRTARPVVAGLGLALAAATLAAVPTATAAGAAGAAGAAAQAPAKRATARTIDGCLRSVPEPGSTEPVRICYTLHKPASANRKRPVPLIMHSHGWAGQRETTAASFADFTRRRYAVLSFDQRGFGESGGQAHVQRPSFEGKDVRKLVKLVSKLRWVKQDGRRDPRLGAIGGSYGGGYQFLGAFEHLRLRGKPVFDALAPEITWHDLNQTLAPEGVVRTEWAAALAAAAVPSDALPPKIYKALVEGSVTGEWPDGSTPGGENVVRFFRKNGPAWHIGNGRRLDIPVLLGQGTTDTLFPLQQGVANSQRALTKKSRKRSMFVGYNGGHTLPAALPAGVNVASDPCSRELAGGDFRKLSIRFFNERLKGRNTSLRGWNRYHLATPGSTCTTVRSVAADRTVPVGEVTTTTTAGPPVAVEVADGPIRIAGSPYLTGSVTALGVKNRAFYGLAMGTSPGDARLVQNNVLPINEPLPVTGIRRRVTLPSVAVDVPAGQKLFLIASATSDTFAGMGSRTPGVVRIEGAHVHLPVVGR